MVGGGSRKDEPLVINSTNVFAALGSLRKKKKASSSSSSHSKGKAAASSSSKRQQQRKEEEQPPVFWAPAPLNAKSWADVEDEDDDDYYATTAPPQSVWAVPIADDPKAKKSSLQHLEESESEEEGLDEVDDDNEEEHENEPEPETLVKKEPVIENPAEVGAPKEPEKQLSKKELKKKELAELEAMLAEFGCSKPEGQDNSHGGTQDKKVGDPNGEVDKKENNAPGESKSAKKKKKKDKSSKDAKQHQDQPNGIKIENATDETDKAEAAPPVDVKEKLKKVAPAKKKKSNKEMDAAAKAAASEAAARNAKLAAAKRKEKNHYNQQPSR